MSSMPRTVSFFICFCLIIASATSSSLVTPDSKDNGEELISPFHYQNDLLAMWPNLSWISTVDLFNEAVRRDPDVQQGGQSCFDNLISIADTLRRGHSLPDWLLAMIDSMGKIPAGVTRGALLWTGDYDQCVQVQKKDNPTFGGRYCTVYWNLHLSNGSQVATLSQGLCVPSTCHSLDIKRYINILLSILRLDPKIRNVLNHTVTFQDIYCHPKEGEREWKPLSIFTISVIIFGVAVSILCSLIEVVISGNDRSSRIIAKAVEQTEESAAGCSQNDGISSPLVESETETLRPSISDIISCFSFTSNLKYFVSQDKQDRRIKGIDGIRVLSLTWIILCHCYLFSMSETNNLLDVVDDADTLSFSVVLNGSFSVDSFFVLSGLLLSFHFMRHHRNDNSQNKNQGCLLACLYLRRIVRILPLYSIVLLIDWSVGHLVSSGPFWDNGDQVTSEKTLCEASWWYNLLFINNFLSLKKQCMAWTWFLANDMQFFIAAPILLIIIQRRRKIGIILVSLLLAACIITTWGVSFFNNLSVGFQTLVQHPDPDYLTSYLDLLYTKPYARAAPYLIGVVVGVFLQKSALHFSKLLSLFLWCVCFSILGLTIFGPFHAHFNYATAATYNALSRVAWGLMVSLLILLTSSTTGRTSYNPISHMLSWSMWTPLARLTYAAYLIHPIVINLILRSLRAPVIYSVLSMISFYASALTCVFVISIPFYLIFEVPVLRLQRLFVP